MFEKKKAHAPGFKAREHSEFHENKVCSLYNILNPVIVHVAQGFDLARVKDCKYIPGHCPLTNP